MIKYFDERGQGYISIKGLCRNRGFDYSSFMRIRKIKGLSIEETCRFYMSNPPKKNRRYERNAPVSCDGVQYKNLGEACDKLKVNRCTVRRRQYLYGLNASEALEVVVHATKKDHLGNKFKSYRDMCRYHRVEYNTFLSRFNHGWSIQECLESKKSIVDDKGQCYESYSQLCKENGFKLNSFFATLYKKNHDVIETCKHLRTKIKKGYTYNGQTYTSLAKLCAAADVDYYRVHYQRFANHVDWQTAFDRVLAKKQSNKLVSIKKKEDGG